jgi:MerR family transcriptional regulator/heat shock protein HspR
MSEPTTIRTRAASIGDVRLGTAARLVHVSPARVRQDVELGLVRPSRVEGAIVFFGESELAQLRRIRRLRRDLGLNTAGVEVTLRLIDEIRRLRDELHAIEIRDRAPAGSRFTREA